MDNNYDIVNARLSKFIEHKQIPNIIFHGSCNTTKEEIVFNFLKNIYNSENNIKKFVMFVDCAHGKGIKFVREDLKHFAKTNVGNEIFKSIILFNADKLTIDAQSALRRCIEIFSHSTRFFMIVDNISKLLNPIISRFCSLLIYEKNMNLYSQEQNISETSIYNTIKDLNSNNIFTISNILYNKGFSGLNIINYINKKYKGENKYFLLFYINKIKKDIRDERLLIAIILNLMQNGNFDSLTDMHFI